MWWREYFKKTVIFALSLALGLYILLCTPWCVAGLVRVVSACMPGCIKVARVEGRLIDTLVLHQVQVQQPSRSFDAERITLTWDPATLLRGHWHLNLAAKHVQNVAGRDFDTWQLRHDSSDLNLRASLNYRAKSLQLDAELGGTWNAAPVSATLLLTQHDGQWALAPFALHLGRNQLTLQATPNHQLNWQFNLLDPAVLLQQGAGLAHGQGTLHDWPHLGGLAGQLAAKQLRWGRHFIADLHGEVTLQKTAKARLGVSLQAKQLKLGRLDLAEVSVQATGYTQRHQILIHANAGPYTLAGRLLGRYTPGQTWQVTASNAQLGSPHGGSWQLQHPTTLRINADRIAIPNLDWHNAQLNADLHGHANWQRDRGWQLQITDANSPLAPWLPGLPPGINLNVRLNAKFEAKLPPHSPARARADIQLQPGAIGFAGNAQSTSQVAEFQGGRLHIDLTQQDLNAHLDFTGSAHNQVTGDLCIQGFSSDRPYAEQALSGQILGELDDLSLLMRYLPQLTRVKGQLSTTTVLSGTRASPGIEAQAQLREGSFTLPQYGLKVKPLTLQVYSDSHGIFHLNGQGKMRRGSGEFSINGYLNPFSPNLDHAIHIQGQEVEFINTEKANIVANPNLTFQLTPTQQVKVSGTLEVLRGKLALEQQFGLVHSNDVVFVDSGAQATGNHGNWTLQPNVYVRIHNQLFLHGYGIDSNISGKLRITARHDNLFGAGRITLKSGTYAMPGKTLHIDHGRLLFPPGTLLSNPVLDIKMQSPKAHMPSVASLTNPAEGNTGLYVTGTLLQPRIEEYGLIERQGAMSTALTAGSSPLTARLQKALSLTQLGLENNGDEYGGSDGSSLLDNKRLVIGKQLGKRFYLQYGHNLSEVTGHDTRYAWQLKYGLNKNWAIGVETTNHGSGADLSFSFESDK